MIEPVLILIFCDAFVKFANPREKHVRWTHPTTYVLDYLSWNTLPYIKNTLTIYYNNLILDYHQYALKSQHTLY